MNSIFQWERPVPEATRRALLSLTPRVDRGSHLVCFWESGVPDDPIQRFVVYEAQPIGLIAPWKVQAFHADPVCRCSFEASTLTVCKRCGGMQSPGRQRILDYLVQTECLAQPFWVVQGHEGGHRLRHTDLEKQWQRLKGLPEDPPAPGDLPFVEPDERTWRKIRLLSRLHKAQQDLGKAYQEEQASAKVAFNQALADYTDTAIEKAFDDIPLQRKGSLIDELPMNFTQSRRSVDLAEKRETFIRGE